MMVARSASIVHVLVERKLPVESDSKASNTRYRLNDSILHLDGSNVIDFVTPPGGHELYNFRFDWVELKAVHQ